MAEAPKDYSYIDDFVEALKAKGVTTMMMETDGVLYHHTSDPKKEYSPFRIKPPKKKLFGKTPQVKLPEMEELFYNLDEFRALSGALQAADIETVFIAQSQDKKVTEAIIKSAIPDTYQNFQFIDTKDIKSQSGSQGKSYHLEEYVKNKEGYENKRVFLVVAEGYRNIDTAFKEKTVRSQGAKRRKAEMESLQKRFCYYKSVEEKEKRNAHMARTYRDDWAEISVAQGGKELRGGDKLKAIGDKVGFFGADRFQAATTAVRESKIPDDLLPAPPSDSNSEVPQEEAHEGMYVETGILEEASESVTTSPQRSEAYPKQQSNTTLSAKKKHEKLMESGLPSPPPPPPPEQSYEQEPSTLKEKLGQRRPKRIFIDYNDIFNESGDFKNAESFKKLLKEAKSLDIKIQVITGERNLHTTTGDKSAAIHTHQIEHDLEYDVVFHATKDQSTSISKSYAKTSKGEGAYLFFVPTTENQQGYIEGFELESPPLPSKPPRRPNKKNTSPSSQEDSSEQKSTFPNQDDDGLGADESYEEATKAAEGEGSEPETEASIRQEKRRSLPLTPSNPLTPSSLSIRKKPKLGEGYDLQDLSEPPQTDLPSQTEPIYSAIPRRPKRKTPPLKQPPEQPPEQPDSESEEETLVVIQEEPRLPKAQSDKESQSSSSFYGEESESNYAELKPFQGSDYAIPQDGRQKDPTYEYSLPQTNQDPSAPPPLPPRPPIRPKIEPSAIKPTLPLSKPEIFKKEQKSVDSHGLIFATEIKSEKSRLFRRKKQRPSDPTWTGQYLTPPTTTNPLGTIIDCKIEGNTITALKESDQEKMPHFIADKSGKVTDCDREMRESLQFLASTIKDRSKQTRCLIIDEEITPKDPNNSPKFAILASELEKKRVPVLIKGQGGKMQPLEINKRSIDGDTIGAEKLTNCFKIGSDFNVSDKKDLQSVGISKPNENSTHIRLTSLGGEGQRGFLNTKSINSSRDFFEIKKGTFRQDQPIFAKELQNLAVSIDKELNPQSNRGMDAPPSTQKIPKRPSLKQTEAENTIPNRPPATSKRKLRPSTPIPLEPQNSKPSRPSKSKLPSPPKSKVTHTDQTPQKPNDSIPNRPSSTKSSSSPIPKKPLKLPKSPNRTIIKEVTQGQADLWRQLSDWISETPALSSLSPENSKKIYLSYKNGKPHSIATKNSRTGTVMLYSYSKNEVTFHPAKTTERPPSPAPSNARQNSKRLSKQLESESCV